MKDLRNIDKIIYFEFDVEPIIIGGVIDNKHIFHSIKKEKGSNRRSNNLKKIWEAHYIGLPSEDHMTATKLGKFRKLSIKRPGNNRRTLCVFKILSGAHFKKDKLPIICTDGNEQGAFGRSFLLRPHRSKKTMVAFDPTDKIPPNAQETGDFSLAACLIDDSKLNGEPCSFAFLIDYVGFPQPKFAPPNDPWPGPPHNNVGL